LTKGKGTRVTLRGKLHPGAQVAKVNARQERTEGEEVYRKGGGRAKETGSASFERRGDGKRSSI